MTNHATVVFDLDGTLVDSAADLIAAANATLADRGLPAALDPVKDASIAFHGGRAMLNAGYARAPRDVLIPPAALDEDFPRLLGHYARNIADSTRPYPGTEQMLNDLTADGYRLAICTNKPEDLARKLLGRLGLDHYFSALIGADTLPTRKPDPAPYRAAVEGAGGQVARSCLIGDTKTDRDTARAVGVRIALVGFGPEGQGVSGLDPDIVIDNFDALPGVVAGWFG